MATLPDIKRSLHSSQVRRVEPPITIRKRAGDCLIQVSCFGYREDEVFYNLDREEITTAFSVPRLMGLEYTWPRTFLKADPCRISQP